VCFLCKLELAADTEKFDDNSIAAETERTTDLNKNHIASPGEY